jgi:2-iminobutanoate/2-iminopropanoate deaminase
VSGVEFVQPAPGVSRAAVASDVVTVGQWAFVVGVAPIDLNNDQVALGDNVEAQTLQIFANLRSLIAPLGLDLDHVVRTTIYLANHDRFVERMNAVYCRQFPAGRLPVRTCVGVTGLVRGAQVVIDFTLFSGTASDGASNAPM